MISSSRRPLLAAALALSLASIPFATPAGPRLAEPPAAAGKGLDPFEGDAPDPAFWSHLATARKVTELIGMPVTDRPDHNLGTVADLLMDLTSGRVLCALVLPTGEDGSNGHIPVPATGLYVQAGKVTLVAEQAVLADVPRLSPGVTDPAALGQAAVHAHAYFKLKFVRPDREERVVAWRSSRLLTRKVKTPAGTVLGTVANLVVDLRSGHAYFAVASRDGSEKNVFAIPPAALLVDRQEPAVLLDANEGKISATANSGGFFWTDILDNDWAVAAYQAYGLGGAGAAAATAGGADADGDLQAKIMGAWKSQKIRDADFANVVVMTAGGVVTLQGKVRSEAIRAKLTTYAEVVAGAGKVVDQLKIGR